MKNKIIPIVTLLLGVSSTSLLANVHYDYARVTKVKPVYQYSTVSQPYQQCYPVTKRSRRNARHHNGSAITGAVIGGVIGNVIGDNRRATVAGALIGGAIGHSSSHARYTSRVVERCETIYHPAKKIRKIKGYQVKYRYHGEAYRTFMSHHPGDRIKVRVKVSPVN